MINIVIARCLYVVVIVQLIVSGHVAEAQLTISATTPSSTPTGTPNTFVGAVGNQIAASLLASGTPALLWGAVPSGDIITACQQIVNTGSLSFSASITDDWGGSEDLTLQVQATGGCLAASDASGTEFVFVDNYGRTSAVVCPSNAGSSGCGVYMTGDDVTALYNSAQGGSKRKLLSSITSRRLLQDCSSGAQSGAISGAVTGVLAISDCLALGPLAPFCAVGVIGVNAALGAVGGCASSCFPGDALVRTPSAGVRLMSQLQVGDEVAVWAQDGSVQYDQIYAFGHKDADATAMFVEITTQAVSFTSTNNNTTAVSTTIRLSGFHFIPTSTSSSSYSPHSTLVYKRAKDVQIGDIVWSSSIAFDDGVPVQQHLVLPHVVKDISTSWSRGLYNPLTMSGTIIVDDVVASVHSDWFLDTAFDMVGLSSWLPHAYQLVLAPVRALYHILGQEAYALVYNRLDAYIDIAKFGTSYGGAYIMGVFIASIATPLLLHHSLVKSH